MSSSEDSISEDNLRNDLDDWIHGKNSHARVLKSHSKSNRGSFAILTELPTDKYRHAKSGMLRKRRHLSYGYESTDSGLSDQEVANLGTVYQKAASIKSKTSISAFESLPAEVYLASALRRSAKEQQILQLIATYANSDQDIRSLVCTSSRFKDTIHSEESTIWRRRFLLRYDFPFIQGTQDFAIAYKLRQFVLKNFVGFGRFDDHSEVQLQVIKDMVLETYGRLSQHLQYPRRSLNLVLMSNLSQSCLMSTFLSTPYANLGCSKYGSPDALFDMLQVTLSHMVLSPQSRLKRTILTSREHFNIVRVYNFDHPLIPIFTRFHVQKPTQPQTAGKASNIRIRQVCVQLPVYYFDVHSVLHIRNFFARHLNDDPTMFEERTYAAMATELARLGRAPRQWYKPIHEPTKMSSMWTGHYSCIHPWPKLRKDLEERQSCAEEWEIIAPMTIDLELSLSNNEESFWPPAFNSIPAISLPSTGMLSGRDPNLTFFRGIAPFVNLEISATNAKEINSDNLNKWHPFKALRVRGYSHDTPITHLKISGSNSKWALGATQNRAVPGWKRVVMIMYKPTTQNLLQVLEYAEEEYGGTYQTELSSLLDTASIWNGAASSTITNGSLTQENITHSSAGYLEHGETSSNVGMSQSSLVSEHETISVQPTSSILSTNPFAEASPSSTNAPTSEEIEARLETILDRRIASFTKSYNNRDGDSTSRSTPRYPLFSASHISHLDSQFIPAHHLSFDQDTNSGAIDYAYAYEGVIIPGGQIMMGRWWKVNGLGGLGKGREVNESGVGVEVRFKDSGSGSGDDDQTENPAHGDDWTWDDSRGVEVFTNVNGTGEVVRDASGTSKGLERGPFCFWAC